jgi:hypothetical protein
MLRRLTLVAFLIAVATVGSAFANSEGKLEYGETKYDFGYIGVDYTGYYNFPIYNAGEDSVRVLGAGASCDCSRVSVSDTIIAPGDTATIRLAYNTRNFRGPTTQTFTVETDNKHLPAITVSYLSVVGQWIDGARPEPLSLYFLPGQKPKQITIANTKFAEMKAKYLDQADTLYSVKFVEDEADKGKDVKIEVTPRKGIGSGTYDSSFRVELNVTNIKEPIILTIPVKIVRY